MDVSQTGDTRPDTVSQLLRAWGSDPTAPGVALQLAVLHVGAGSFDEGELWSRRALDLDEQNTGARRCLAVALHNLGRLPEAWQAYRLLLLAGLQDATLHANVAALCLQLGLRPEALHYLRVAAEGAPDDPRIAGDLIHQSLHLSEWDGLNARSQALLEQSRRSHRWASPFSTLSLPGATAADHLAAAESAASTLAAGAGAPLHAPPRGRVRKRPLRVGYLSSDLHGHPTAYLMVRLLELHDPEQFELYAYSWGPAEDSDFRRRLQAPFRQFREVQSLSDRSVAEQIRRDEIDLLVDLKGHTYRGRLGISALRPAPIQVHHLGFPGSLGADFVDYFIADPFVAPSDLSSSFREKLAYLPDCYQPTDPYRQVGPQRSREHWGLPPEGCVLASFNHPYKLTPDVFDAWCAVLRAVPSSVLWVLCWVPTACEHLKAEARDRGVDAGRIHFASHVDATDHLGRLRSADLLLDTFPVTSHTTASDALWAGVPLLTRCGDTFVSRVAGSILRCQGLTELVTNDTETYIERAVQLARDPARVAVLRLKVEQSRRSGPLFDAERYTRNLEALYLRMWERARQGLSPETLEAEPVA